MAVKDLTAADKLYPNCVTLSWSALANGDTGLPATWPHYNDRTVQVGGTFGVGGSCKIEGSNDGVNYFTLNDPQGNDLVFTAAGMKVIAECPLHTRPSVTAGDGTTAIDVNIQCTKGAR